MSLRKEKPLEKTGPQPFATPSFGCDPNAPYWKEKSTKGQIYAMALIRREYDLTNIRGDENFSYENLKKERALAKKRDEEFSCEEKKDEEKKIIQCQLVVIGKTAIEEAGAYILNGKEKLKTAFGVILPEKPEEQEKFWKDLVDKLEKC